jgi:hypothetical protein
MAAGWEAPLGIARKTIIITRIMAMATTGSLYFFNNDGFSGE